MQKPEIISKLKLFFQQYQHLHYPVGQVILPAFSEVPGVYYVVKGLVKQYILTAAGQELVINVYKPGSYFPMIAALTGQQNKYFFEAMEDIELYRAPVNDTVRFLRQEPDVLLDLTTRLYIGIDGLLQQMTLNTLGTTYQKVVSTLLIAAKRFGQLEGKSITLTKKIYHKEMGLMSGTSRESITRTLKKLQEKNLIAIDHKIITIRDIDAMERELALS